MTKPIPIRSLRGLMMTTPFSTIVGTCVGEVERADRKEMVWVALVKGSSIATLDGMFNAEELRYIADWIENKEAPPPPPEEPVWFHGRPDGKSE